jgi:uncharacterized protein (DUF433 family)
VAARKRAPRADPGPCPNFEQEVHVNWEEHIHSDPAILVGKPVVRGTRLAVEFILELFAAGWTPEQVLESYPTLTEDGLRAVFAYAAEVMHSERLYPIHPGAA